MKWPFGGSYPTYADINFLFFLLLMPDLNVQSWNISATVTSPLDSEIAVSANYPLQLLLAQEEARCLEEFGGRENKTVEYNVFVPYTCLTNSVTFTECEMCRGLTTHVRRPAECQTYCESTDWESCAQKCFGIVKSVMELLEAAKISASKNKITVDDILSQEKQNHSYAGTRRSLQSFPVMLQYVRGNMNLSSPGLLERPRIFCEDVLPPSSSTGEGSHIVFLAWNVGDLKSQAERNNTSFPSGRLAVHSVENQSFPIVFVLEKLSSADPHWITLGKTLQGLQNLSVSYRSEQLKWRVTAVGPSGVIDRVSSEDLRTVDGYLEPGPPKKIYVVREVLRQGMIDVLIGWDPPDERPCGYKIMLHPLLDTSQRAQTSRHNEPLGVHQQWFKGLKFGGRYDVIITSRTTGFESTLTSQKFTTMSCLAAYKNRFDKCEPPAPSNISYQILSFLPGERADDRGKVRVRLSWFPPAFTSKTNRIENYTVSLGPTFNETGHNQSLTGATYLTHVVPGNTTQVYLGELIANTQYAITLHANSTKGRSLGIQYILSTKLGRDEDYKSSLSNWFYLSIPMSAVVIALFGCHFLRVYFQKRQVKIARNHYFQSMEERDALSCDWSIVPLNEDSPSFKLLHDFPKEKWEIGYENLSMGEVIGQGAFGVVRRAKMARKTLQTVSHKYANLFNTTDNVDSEGMETVAVKMLKVSATRDDRDQLIKEIVTMQNLGCHPQIVSLLGACTKGRSLCLVLEYCPGGDLLTFLRKVRAKYWPMLGLSGPNRNRSSCSSTKSGSCGSNGIAIGGESEATSMSSCRKSTDSSPINYADMGYSNHSLSTDQTSPPTAVAPPSEEYSNTNNNETTAPVNSEVPDKPSQLNPSESLESDDDCRPIDERDVLSYARQVALGMEYLERNHVVHRDLAGRNVLLLGDYKQVKISDFGLSRDIYTWNVYHQKSNGKLPIKWMAIESIFTHVFTSKSDVWSYGILLWELVTLGGTPYPGLGNTELFHLLKSGYRMERPDNCSEELYALMKKCWRSAPASRPNFTELHRYLETMLEAAEPNLYLSLMADLPTDYFHLGSCTNIEDESISCENSRQSHSYPNGRIQGQGQQPNHRQSSNHHCNHNDSFNSCSNNGKSSSKTCNNSRCRTNSQMSSNGKNNSVRNPHVVRPRQPSPPQRPILLSSPDSGVRPSVSENEEDDCGGSKGGGGEDVSLLNDSQGSDRTSIPLKCINNITIIENRTYDITDL